MATLKTYFTNANFWLVLAHPFKTLPCDIPSYPLNLKVVILGNRTEIATLGELEEDLYSLADYAEMKAIILLHNLKHKKIGPIMCWH